MAGEPMVIQPPLTLSNAGTMRAAAGATLQIATLLTNSGYVLINAGGVLAATAGYAQTSIGELAVEVAGTAASSVGALNVTGTATLNGTLSISIVGGYSPALADRSTVLRYTTRSGSFATTNGTAIGGGLAYELQYGASALELVVVTAP
jgi:hypothetical protein